MPENDGLQSRGRTEKRGNDEEKLAVLKVVAHEKLIGLEQIRKRRAELLIKTENVHKHNRAFGRHGALSVPMAAPVTPSRGKPKWPLMSKKLMPQLMQKAAAETAKAILTVSTLRNIASVTLVNSK